MRGRGTPRPPCGLPPERLLDGGAQVGGQGLGLLEHAAKRSAWVRTGRFLPEFFDTSLQLLDGGLSAPVLGG